MKYILSFEAEIEHTHTSVPKWWQFWKQVEVTQSMVWNRYTFPIDEAEYQRLQNSSEMNTLDSYVQSKVLTLGNVPRIRNVQVEQVHSYTSPYITTG